jgi:hypothetical protein
MVGVALQVDQAAGGVCKANKTAATGIVGADGEGFLNPPGPVVNENGIWLQCSAEDASSGQYPGGTTAYLKKIPSGNLRLYQTIILLFSLYQNFLYQDFPPLKTENWQLSGGKNCQYGKSIGYFSPSIRGY